MKWTTSISWLAAGLCWFIPQIGTVAADEPRTGAAIEVVTSYAGMPAVSVEKTITDRVERWVSQAAGVSRVESRSLNGVSMVRVYFGPKVVRDAALKQVKDLVLGVMPNLPPGTPPPIIHTFDPAEPPPAGFVVVSGTMLDETQLRDLARERVVAELAKISGISAPTIIGGTERVTQISIDAKRLEARNIPPADVIKALQASQKAARVRTSESRFIGSGGNTLDSTSAYENLAANIEKGIWVIEVRPAAADIEKLGDLIVRAAPNSEVRLKDIAAISLGSAAQTEIVRFDGRRAVCVPVQFGSDTSDATRKTLQSSLSTIEKSLPDRVHIRFALDRNDASRQLVLRFRTENGDLAAAEKTIADVEQFVIANIGSDKRSMLSVVASDPAALGWDASAATIRVQIDDRYAADLVVELRRKFMQEQRFSRIAAWFQAGARAHPPIRIRLKGKDLNVIMAVATKLRVEAARERGAADVLIDVNPAEPALSITADREKAASIGLTTRDVLRQAVGAIGAPMQPLELVRDTVTVQLKQVPNLQNVLDSTVTGANLKGPIRLGNLVELRRVMQPAASQHVDMERAADIWVNAEGRPVADLARAIEERIKRITLPKGVAASVIHDSNSGGPP